LINAKLLDARIDSGHRRNLRGIQGKAPWPPKVLERGYRTPTFWAYGRKNNIDFPSSSAHVSLYNIQGNFWRPWGFAPETDYRQGDTKSHSGKIEIIFFDEWNALHSTS